jgi:hypothetical protein
MSTRANGRVKITHYLMHVWSRSKAVCSVNEAGKEAPECGEIKSMRSTAVETSGKGPTSARATMRLAPIHPLPASDVIAASGQ